SYEQPIVLVTDDEQQRHDAMIQLIRIGLDHIDGHLAGGVEAWQGAAFELDHLETISPHAGSERLNVAASVRPLLLDVRTDAEWHAGHVDQAQHIFLGHLSQRIAEIPTDKPILIMCGSGYRSSIAGSILLRNGIERVTSIAGGMDAWLAANLPVTHS